MLSTQAHAAEVSTTASITTDYVWRGSSQTQGDPALQGSFKLSGASGFYASVWGSNVDFTPDTGAHTELDFTVGWARALSKNWAVDVNVLHYRYPSAALDLDWTELNGTFSYKGNYWISVGYSSEALGYDAAGTYTLIGAKFPVNDRLRFEAGAGHYFLDDDVIARSGYTHGWVSAIWTINPALEARLSMHGTDQKAKAIFGNELAGSRIEAAMQATF